ncbi:MAG TPA: type II secretion system F family protein [Pirellulaceae bacterium]|nr:type II secretion system F family protein [Pirellulaceae bacterium]
MPDFAYIARNMQGLKVSGTVSAGSEREALSLLSTQSLFPVSVKAEQSKQAISFNLSRRVSGQVIAQTFGQMAQLLRSGVPLMRSLKVMRDQSSHAGLKAVLEDVSSRVEDGDTLAEAFARHPRVFGDMAINMIRAGGEGGFLEDALERIAQFTEQQEELKSRTMGALAYPVVLGTIGSLIVTVLIVFFVPKFAEMFDRLREAGELPALTAWLLWFSDTLRSPAAIVGLVIAGIGGYWLRSYLQTDAGRRKFDYVKLKLPLYGPIAKNLAVARFCRVLGTMMHNGVPILKSLEISSAAAGNTVLSAAISSASDNISAGQSLSRPLAACGHFPSTVIEMISVAEEANTLDKVLVEVADGLEKRTFRQLDLMVRLLEPLMLLVLAFVVLLVVIALLLPIFKMFNTL